MKFPWNIRFSCIPLEFSKFLYAKLQDVEFFPIVPMYQSFLKQKLFQVHYILHLNRRPIYYITVIVVPTFLISALSILGIFSPGSNDGPRNEKVSFWKSECFFGEPQHEVWDYPQQQRQSKFSESSATWELCKKKKSIRIARKRGLMNNIRIKINLHTLAKTL